MLVGTSRDEARLEIGRKLGATVTLMADQDDVVERTKLRWA